MKIRSKIYIVPILLTQGFIQHLFLLRIFFRKKKFLEKKMIKLNYISQDLDLYINFFKDGIVCMGTAASKNQVICIKNRVKNDRNIFQITAFLCSKAKQGNTERKNSKSQIPIYFEFILIFFISSFARNNFFVILYPFFHTQPTKNVQ